jgi:hypothetical protein
MTRRSSSPLRSDLTDDYAILTKLLCEVIAPIASRCRHGVRRFRVVPEKLQPTGLAAGANTST